MQQMCFHVNSTLIYFSEYYFFFKDPPKVFTEQTEHAVIS